MDVERRVVLNGLVVTSVAGLTLTNHSLSLARAVIGDQAQPALPLAVVVSGAPDQFIHGISTAIQARNLEVYRTDLSMSFLQDVNRMLQSKPSIRLVGLVDDASAALIIQLARSAGARLQWMAQHAADAGGSRHRVLSAAAAYACALQLGQRLVACGTEFDLRIERPMSVESPLDLVVRSGKARGSDEWATTLGFALASLGTAQAAMAAPAAPASARLSGSFVSFLIES